MAVPDQQRGQRPDRQERQRDDELDPSRDWFASDPSRFPQAGLTVVGQVSPSHAKPEQSR